jgi:hypothetical protein
MKAHDEALFSTSNAEEEEADATSATTEEVAG